MFKMEFKTSNDAFRNPYTGEESERHKVSETIKTLTKVAESLMNGKTDGVIMDINGNKIGKWSLD